MWEVTSHPSKDDKEKSFEGPDRDLCRILVMHVRGNMSEVDSPLISHPLLVLLPVFIVQGLYIYRQAFVPEAMHCQIVCCQAERVLSGLEWFKEDYIRQVLGHHHVLIATPCSKQRSACVVSA